MTPRDVTGEAVETPALDELFERVRVTGSRKKVGDDLVSRARFELSRLKSRPKVSVEEAEIVALCRDALFDVREEGPVRKGLVAIDQEKWQRAVAALNGEVVNEPVPDWCWSSLRREWFKR